MNISAFTPGATTTLTATTTNGDAQLLGTGQAVEVQNSGSVTVFVKLGSSASTTASTADYPVLPGQSKLINRDPNGQSYIAAVTASGSAVIYATTGEGA